jgi:hypothetical protein
MKIMKSKNVKLFLLLSIAGLSSVLLTSCKEEPFATITIDETGSDLGGDVTGDGGSTSQTYTWNNSLTTADWNMDITASAGGSFRLLIKDADGATVLDNTLTKGVGDDSASGVTSAGTAGDWQVTVTLTDFNGDGSFSLSPGN